MDHADNSQIADLLHRLTPPVEALANLSWLILHESEHVDKVRFYAQLAEQQISELRTIMLAATDPKP
jgi:hypothetical protein